jgi:hypothetical protein
VCICSIEKVCVYIYTGVPNVYIFTQVCHIVALMPKSEMEQCAYILTQVYLMCVYIYCTGVSDRGVDAKG